MNTELKEELREMIIDYLDEQYETINDGKGFDIDAAADEILEDDTKNMILVKMLKTEFNQGYEDPYDAIQVWLQEYR